MAGTLLRSAPMLGARTILAGAPPGGDAQPSPPCAPRRRTSRAAAHPPTALPARPRHAIDMPPPRRRLSASACPLAASQAAAVERI